MRREIKIVDTNVLVAANWLAIHRDYLSMEKCITFLINLRMDGIFVVDELWEILLEYNKKCVYWNKPYWNIILKHIIDHQYNTDRVIRVPITPNNKVAPWEDWYDEIDSIFQPPLKTDKSDRKFIAVHHASKCKFSIVNATDSDWNKLKTDMKSAWISDSLLKVEELLT
jgi:hypothetical protein